MSSSEVRPCSLSSAGKLRRASGPEALPHGRDELLCADTTSLVEGLLAFSAPAGRRLPDEVEGLTGGAIFAELGVERWRISPSQVVT